MSTPTNKKIITRLSALALLPLFLLSIIVLLANYQISTQFYDFFLYFSFVLALVSACLALVKFITRKKDKYYFISLGLFGASFLELYQIFSNSGTDNLHLLSPSAALLSLFVFIGLIASKIHSTFLRPLGLLILPSLFIPFILFNLSPYLTIIAVVFFLVSLIGFLVKGVWKRKYFEYWLLFFIITFLVAEAALFFSIPSLYLIFIILRLLAYIFIATGLLMSSYNAFRLVEEFSKTSDARLRASILSLPLGYFVTDTKGNVSFTNSETKNIYSEKSDYKLRYLLRKQLNLEAICAKCLISKSGLTINEIIYNNKFFRLFVTPIVFENEITGMVFVLQDITEAKIIDHAKDEFIALASHELRTPLSVIKGNTEIIKTQILPNLNIKSQDLNEMTDDILESSLRLITIVDEFLDVSSLEQQRIFFQFANFNLADILGETLSLFAPIARRKQLTLEINTDTPKKILVYADKPKVKQILYNLVDNAIKFTVKGGIKIKAYTKENHVFVEIVDTGKGIEKEHQEKLFKKLREVGKDFLTHDSTKGVGLGLYISKMLVEKMNGKIYLEKSNPDHGSTFIFTLPLATDENLPKSEQKV